MKKIIAFLFTLSMIAPSFAEEWKVIYTDKVWFATHSKKQNLGYGVVQLWTVLGIFGNGNFTDLAMIQDSQYDCSSGRSRVLRTIFIESDGFHPAPQSTIEWSEAPIPGTFVMKQANLACGKVNGQFRINVENTLDLPKKVKQYLGK